jgi:hypothetical protein
MHAHAAMFRHIVKGQRAAAARTRSLALHFPVNFLRQQRKGEYRISPREHIVLQIKTNITVDLFLSLCSPKEPSARGEVNEKRDFNC